MWDAYPPQAWNLVARPDFVISESGWSIVDINAHSLAGHFPLNDLLIRAQEDAARRSLITEAAPRPVMDKYAAMLRRCLQRESDLIVLAYFGSEDELPGGNASRWHMDAQAYELAKRGLSAVVAPVENLQIEKRHMVLDGVAVGVVQRFFLPAPGEPDKIQQAVRIGRACGDGSGHVVTSMRGELLNTKGTLAVLSDESITSALGTRLAQTLGAVVPWTRFVEDRPATRDGERVDLLEWVAGNRDQLVLKPSLGTMGQQVTIGREVTREAWESALQDALGAQEPWVVQELRESLYHSLRFLDRDGDTHEVSGPAVYGAYVLDGYLCGAICRYGRWGSSSLMINGTTGAIPSPVYWHK